METRIPGDGKCRHKIVVPNGALLDDVASLLAEGYSVSLRAKGQSMFPFIVGGRDEVVLRKEACVQVGDIVLARLAGRRYVLHRVCRLEPDCLLLMGDGNVQGCEACLPGEVCGVVQQIVRNGCRVDCRSPRERRRVALWCRLLPVRRVILALWHRWRRWTNQTERNYG